VLIKRLKDVLETKGVTIYWLAQRTGVSWQNLKKIENGKTTRINFELLDKLCEVLECQPGDLLRYSKNSKQKKQRVSKKQSK
jgi:putative transcriptional regulator